MARFYNLRLISFVFDVMFILDFIFTYAVNHRHWPNTYGIKRSSLWTRVNKKRDLTSTQFFQDIFNLQFIESTIWTNKLLQ